jgi:hypothetical protein
MFVTYHFNFEGLIVDRWSSHGAWRVERGAWSVARGAWRVARNEWWKEGRGLLPYCSTCDRPVRFIVTGVQVLRHVQTEVEEFSVLQLQEIVQRVAMPDDVVLWWEGWSRSEQDKYSTDRATTKTRTTNKHTNTQLAH